MTSSSLKSVRFYKIGGIKQNALYENQNLNPNQFGYGNQYPLILYQFDSLTTNSQSHDYDSKYSQYYKMQKIEDDEKKIETMEENSVASNNKKNENFENKIIQESNKKESEKFKESDRLKQKYNLNNSINLINLKQKKSIVKYAGEKDLVSDFNEKIKEVEEKFGKNNEVKIETPRFKDGKSFSIRGTTKTVIEVTTTEVVDQSIFKVKDEPNSNFFKKISQKIETIQEKKNEKQDTKNKLIKVGEVLNEEIVDKNHKKIQTDADTKIDQITIKNIKSLNKKVDKETGAKKSMIDKFLGDKEKLNKTKLLEPSKQTDQEEDHSFNKNNHKKIYENLNTSKRISYSLENKKV